MKFYYFEVCYGYYLSGISRDNQEIQYSLSEDDRLWFSKEQVDRIEKMLKESFRIQYSLRKDKEFVDLLQDYMQKGIIDEEYLGGCYKCYLK